MIEPSQYVKDLIAAKSAINPNSMTPREFSELWANARQLALTITAELTTPNADMQRVSELTSELAPQAARLKAADIELRSQTPNGKRPRSHRGVTEIDYALDIERNLMSALSCMRYGDNQENLLRLSRHASDAHYLIADALAESKKLQGG